MRTLRPDPPRLERPPHDLWPRLRARLAERRRRRAALPGARLARGDGVRRRRRHARRRARSRPLPLRVRASVMVRRRDLLAYLIGAGVAGTLLTAPYALRVAAISLLPGATIGNVPFFLLPILWGVWNLLWARWQPAVTIGTWGAMLGVVAGVAVNLALRRRGRVVPRGDPAARVPARRLLPALPARHRSARRSARCRGRALR